jgi:hypothetical protein
MQVLCYSRIVCSEVLAELLDLETLVQSSICIHEPESVPLSCMQVIKNLFLTQLVPPSLQGLSVLRGFDVIWDL